MSTWKTVNVVLSEEDIDKIENKRVRSGLGRKGFSAALRMILREWDDFVNNPDTKYRIISIEEMPGPDGAQRPRLMKVEKE